MQEASVSQVVARSRLSIVRPSRMEGKKMKEKKRLKGESPDSDCLDDYKIIME